MIESAFSSFIRPGRKEVHREEDFSIICPPGEGGGGGRYRSGPES